MSFNENDVNRDRSGKFDTKVGSVPAIELEASPPTAPIDLSRALIAAGEGEAFTDLLQHQAVIAAQEAPADDVETMRSALDLADTVEDEHSDIASYLRDAVQEKIGENPSRLSSDANGQYVWDFDAVAAREKAHRESVAQLSEAASIYTRNPDHWAQVAWAADPDRTESELASVLLNESEPEFYQAVLQHPEATPEMVTYAARHNSASVWQSVIAHTNTTPAALDEVQTKLDRDIRDGNDPMLAWGTMRSHYHTMRDQAIRMSGMITARRSELA